MHIVIYYIILSDFFIEQHLFILKSINYFIENIFFFLHYFQLN